MTITGQTTEFSSDISEIDLRDDDIVVVLDDGLQICLDGTVEIDIESKDESFAHEFGTEHQEAHYIDRAVCHIEQVYNYKSGDEITLLKDEMSKIRAEINSHYESLGVE